MSNAIVRLLLNTQDYDRNIKKTQDQMKAFEGKISAAGATMMKFAGGLGVAMSAGEAFNKMINSSQTLSDEYNRTIDGLKGGVDEFFYSLSNGDWSGFLNGMQETIRLSREAYTALDSLGNATMSYGYFNQKNMAEVQKQLAIIKDKNSTKEQIEAAKKVLDETLKDQRGIVEAYSQKSDAAMQAMVKAAIGFDGVDVSQMSVDRVLRLDVSLTGDAEKAELDKQYKEFAAQAEQLKKKYSKIEQSGYGMFGGTKIVTDYEAMNKEMAPLLAKYQDAVQYNAILVKKNDEWLQSLINVSNGAENAKRNLESMQKSANRASQSGSSGTGGKKGKSGSKVSPEQMLQWNIDGWVNEEMKGLHNKLRSAAENFEKVPIQPLDIDLNEDVEELALPKFKTEEEQAEEYAKKLGYVSEAFGMLNGAARTMNNDTLSFITGSFASIAQMIQSLHALAMAEGVASAAKLPFPASLAAIATVISTVASIFSSMPKYADGGIIGGSSRMGDHMVARVNAGEMILNTTQQGRLFEMINNGTIGGNIQVGGSVTVNGSKMILAITNEMLRTGKRFPK